MTSTTNLIISTILLVLIIILNIYQKRKATEVYKDTLYQKTNKLKKILYLLSFFTFIVVLIINLIVLGNDPSIKTTITYLINSLSMFILVSPLTLSNLYINYFKNEEKLSHIKTIITNKIDDKLLKKFKKADINIILLSKEKHDLKLKNIEETQIKKSLLTKNLHIQTDNLNLLDKLINKENTIQEFKNIQKLYNDIYNARGTHDNYIRNIKYIIRTYLSLIISYIFLLIMEFPVVYNILLIIILKIFTILTSNLVYRKLPYDKDIMERKVKDKNIILGKQETFLTIIESFCISFAITLPYMFVLSQGSSQELANTIYYIVFIYIELFLTFSNISDSFIIVNIFKSIKNIRLILYTIISILLVVFFNYTSIFNTRNIYLQNNLSCLLFSLVPVIFIELTKLSRYLSMKGKKKNELKDNKKQRRSKSNNT